MAVLTQFGRTGLPPQILPVCQGGTIGHGGPGHSIGVTVVLTDRSRCQLAAKQARKQQKAQRKTVVSGKPRSVRQAQAQHAAQLRAEGRTWAEIGVAFQVAYRVNPRVALRQAHGWSQPQAAEEWTSIWPDDPKTFKNFSYWEQWPGKTGHAPSLETLDRLARLYQCRITDLLSDCRDYSGRSAVLAVRERAVAQSQPFVPSQPGQVGLGQVRDHDQARGRGLPPDRASGWSHDRTRSGSADRAHPATEDLPADRAPAVSSAALQAALETIRRAQITQLIQAGNVAEEPGPGCAVAPCCSRRAARSPWSPRPPCLRCQGWSPVQDQAV